MKSNKKNIIIILTITFVIAAILLLVIGRFIPFETESENPQQGQIFLYGEEHSNEIILEKELELWNTYYNENEMRHLFVELPYYTAEFLNLWMQSDNDDILNQLYQDWEGTALYSDDVTAFYKQIKLQCPETIFHGTDVGHQYHTTGQRYLEYLEANGQKETTSYQLAAENVEQGKTYYANSDNIYRENTMTENFIREFDSLDGASIMGIYGSAHTGISSKDYYTKADGTVYTEYHRSDGNTWLDSPTTEEFTID